jgi:chitodextrinase
VTVANADTTNPTVSMTAPAEGATVVGTSVSLSANASDDRGVAGVQFQVDGNNIGAEDTTSPYGVSWNSATVGDGPHTLTAIARDAANNKTTSTAVHVTVANNDTTNPTVSLTAPTEGATVLGTTVSLTANASDDRGVAGVQFQVDGNNIGSEDTTSPYGVSWDSTTVGDGPHTLTAIARDAANNKTTSTAIHVTVANADTTFPTVSLTAPADGATVFGTTVSVTANAADNRGVAGVQFQVDGNNVGSEDTTAPYSVAWNTTTVGDGPHQLTAIARDAANNKTTSTAVNVTVANADTQAPTTPTNLHTTSVTTNSITLAWDASTDNRGVASYGLYVFSLPSGNTPATSTTFGSLGCGTSYDLGVDAYDLANNHSSIAILTVSTLPCDTTPPAVSVTAPANGATVNGTISVTANATDAGGVVGVQFKLDGNNLGAEDTSSPYSVSWNTTTASNGPHQLTAVARDTSSNSATSTTVNVTVNNNAAPAGLVAAYSFNEGQGANVTDSSGSGNNGTTANTTWSTTGKYGKALSFNGTSSMVTIPDASSLDLSGAYTIEAWVNASVLSGWRTILMKEFNGNFSYALYANTSSNRARAYVGETGLGVNSAAKLAANAWVHVAATYDGTNNRIYVNGTQSATATVRTTMPNSTGPLRIGGNSIWGEFFQGQIDEVRIYNRALSAAEIGTDMNTAISP